MKLLTLWGSLVEHMCLVVASSLRFLSYYMLCMTSGICGLFSNFSKSRG